MIGIVDRPTILHHPKTLQLEESIKQNIVDLQGVGAASEIVESGTIGSTGSHGTQETFTQTQHGLRLRSAIEVACEKSARLFQELTQKLSALQSSRFSQMIKVSVGKNHTSLIPPEPNTGAKTGQTGIPTHASRLVRRLTQPNIGVSQNRNTRAHSHGTLFPTQITVAAQTVPAKMGQRQLKISPLMRQDLLKRNEMRTFSLYQFDNPGKPVSPGVLPVLPLTITSVEIQYAEPAIDFFSRLR